MSNGALRQGNLKDEIARHIRQMVFTGKIRPGSRVDQDQLSTELGVSKVPIREALIALESEGLVINVARRGWFVAEIEPEDLLDHYRMMAFLEGMVARRATERLGDDGVARLNSIVEAMSPEAGRTQAELEKLNWDFHWIINSSTSSRRLRAILKLFSQAVPADFFEIVDGWDAASHEDHIKIARAIQGRDPEAAEAAMREHLMRGGAQAVEFLTRQGFWDLEPTDSPASSSAT